MHTVFQIGHPPTTAAGARLPLPLEGTHAFLDGRTLVLLAALETPDSAEREAVDQGRARVRIVQTAGRLALSVRLTADAPVALVCRMPTPAGLTAPVPGAPFRLVVALCDTESGLLVAVHRSALPEQVESALWTPDDPESTRLRRTG